MVAALVLLGVGHRRRAKLAASIALAPLHPCITLWVALLHPRLLLHRALLLELGSLHLGARPMPPWELLHLGWCFCYEVMVRPYTVRHDFVSAHCNTAVGV